MAADVQLSDLFASAVGATRAGDDDRFFEVGGTSLKAMRLLREVQQAYGVRLPLRGFYRNPTIAGLRELLRDASATVAPAELEPGTRSASFPLSFGQEQIYVLEAMFPENLAYNANVAIHFEGVLDVGALREALRDVIASHEVFRIALDVEDDEPQLRVHEAVDLPFNEVTVASDGAELQRLIKDEIQRPFDLSAPPLVRWTLARVSETHHVLIQVEHHFVHDGLSLSMLIGEIWRRYAAAAEGRPLPAVQEPMEFSDFVRYQRRWIESDEAAAQLAFWQEHLRDARPAVLVSSRPRPPRTTLRGDVVRRTVAPATVRSAREYAARRNTTLFVVMLTAFVRMLASHLAESRFTIGTGFANRRLPGAQSIIGMLVNIVALNVDLSRAETFGDSVEVVQDLVAGAYDAQECPLELIVRKINPKRRTGNPFFEVAYHFHDAPVDELSGEGVRGRVDYLHNGSAKFELSVVNIPRHDGSMESMWEYRSDLLDPEFVSSLAASFDDELANGVAESAMRPAAT